MQTNNAKDILETTSRLEDSLLAEALFLVFADGRKETFLPSANTRKRASASRETRGMCLTLCTMSPPPPPPLFQNAPPPLTTKTIEKKPKSLTSTVMHGHKRMGFAATIFQACSLGFLSVHIHQMSEIKSHMLLHRSVTERLTFMKLSDIYYGCKIKTKRWRLLSTKTSCDALSNSRQCVSISGRL